MAEVGEPSSAPPYSSVEKPVFVRVKRRASHSPVNAFWLEINERPLKRPLLDFDKLSITDSPEKEKPNSKKVFVQHVETVCSSDATIDVLRSLVPNSTKILDDKEHGKDGKHIVKRESIRQKQDELLLKARHEREVLARSARFEQIWRSRKGKKEAIHEDGLYKLCHVYDVVSVDEEEISRETKVQEELSVEDQKLLCSYLPLIQECIPDAVADIESDILSSDDYVYDLYTVKDGMELTDETSSSPFPLVQVDYDDEIFDDVADSEYETDDSNAEDNPINDYPEEESCEDEEDISRSSGHESEDSEGESDSNRSSVLQDSERHHEDDDLFYEDDMYGVDDDYDNKICSSNDDDGEDEDMRWAYR
ncbi:Transcription factor Iwr1 domain [Dillenia turbinata]|uniref:Transcription factor Iwr1 domain n=1 Tax=Dillenia turbinata TaxID=194707 RepID=A0AAN8V5Q1_9MAGN